MRRRERVLATMFLVFLVAVSAIGQTATAPSAGDGTSGDPYQIATLDNLYWITQNTLEWGKYFLQTANIDASSTSGWDSGSGFSPIGAGTPSFTGTYDGNGFTISGLTIARSSTDYVGLFGHISDGVVKNVTLTSVNISGASYVGSVVGFSGGSGSSLIENCSSTGTVSGTTSSIGGLIGSSAAATTITQCFSTATVSSTSGSYVGGFIGRHQQGSSITSSYSRGNVSSPDGDFVGGFAGGVVFVSPSSPTVSNSYSTGDAYSYNRAGGFVGVMQSATITNSYSIGSATLNGGSTSGGFVALNVSGTVNNCFWDTQASGNGSSAAGTGKTTSELMTASTFTDAGWDFTGTWEMIGSNYPRLQSIPDGALPVQMVGMHAEVISGGSAPRRGSGHEVRLSWTTASEVDNLGWEVERRAIGELRPSTPLGTRVSSVDYQTIGFVEGAGTSSAAREYTFTDHALFDNRQSPIDNPTRFAYRLKQLDRSGSYSYSHEVEVEIGSAPNVFALDQNYPNPFNPSTVISFTVAEEGRTTLKVFSLLGQEVASLFDAVTEPGARHTVSFDASHLAAGTYLARLESGSKQFTRRLLLAK